MSQAIAAPTENGNGVAFTVTALDFTRHQCIISAEALAALSSHRRGNAEPLEIFRAYEAKICGVARRLIAANVKGDPLLLEPHSFH